MQPDVGIERMRTLYAMLAGIPMDAIDLYYWRDGYDQTDHALLHNCDSIACAIGWACAYPPFVAEGLRWDNFFNTPAYQSTTNWTAISDFFHLDVRPETIFGFDGVYDEIVPAHLHKQIVLRKIRKYLLQHGAITKKRSKRLRKQERTLC